MKSVTQFKTSQGKGELIYNKNWPLISLHSTEKAFPPPPSPHQHTHTHTHIDTQKEKKTLWWGLRPTFVSKELNFMTRNKCPVLQFFITILFYSKLFHCHVVKVIQYKVTPEKKNVNQRLLPRIVGNTTASSIGSNAIIIIIISIIIIIIVIITWLSKSNGCCLFDVTSRYLLTSYIDNIACTDLRETKVNFD